ncbi:MAG: short-chain fatty acyl-CoA regulator family protein [Pseudomonadota bacterium]
MPRSLAGSRIREARRQSGLTQIALANTVGISASYLNLIEHNRRRIGGALLNSLAEALGTRAAELSDGGNPTAVPDIQTALSEQPGASADGASAEEFAGRFPDWAELITLQHRRIRDQQAVIAALSDRLAHDPFLSENVHAMLSHITAIRSTAGILMTVDKVPDGQRRRFYASMDAESQRLTSTTKQLADYLGAAGDAMAHAATSEETLDNFLAAHDHHFASLDDLCDGPHTVAQVDTLISGLMAGAKIDPDEAPVHALVESTLRQYAADAAAMPLARFVDAARAAAFDPAALAETFAQPVPSVFRRLSSLARPTLDVPQFGLLVVTASGYPLLRRPLPSMALPRHGNACPLWPVFQAFARPGEPMLHELIHDTDQTFVALTYAAPRHTPSFGEPVDLAASMLFVETAVSPFAEPVGRGRLVGTSCRICTRSECGSRAQAQLLV